MFSCIGKKTEKIQHSRNNVVNVHNRVKEIKMDGVYSSYSRIYLADSYLLIRDSKSLDKLISIFDKKTFKYIKSICQQGPGPEEITRIGFIGRSGIKNKIFVTDNGKWKVYRYDIDSAITFSNYIPNVKMNLNKKAFPNTYICLNDTLAIGVMIKPTGNSGYNEEIARFNFKTGNFVPMKYTQPDIIRKRVFFTVSKEKKECVECYQNNDLITITDLYGNLKYNIYGPGWKERNNHLSFYKGVAFYNDKIITLYSEGKNKYNGDSCPTKFLVFNENGDYIKTLETNYRISEFCIDKENDRIIMMMDDIMQFAYLDLDGLL